MIKFFTKFSLKVQSLLVASLLAVIVGITLTCVNYFVMGNFSIEQMEDSSIATVEAWSADVESVEIGDYMQNGKAGDEVSTFLIDHFDNLSKYQPQVAQGYIFGVELENGTDTTIVSAPTEVIEFYESLGLGKGDLYTQPDVIVKAIEELKETKEIVASEIYEDGYGKWFSVLKPIFNNSGEVIAYYGVDFDATPYLNIQKSGLVRSVTILLGLLVIILIIQYLYTRKIFQPLERFKEALNEVATGDYSVRLKESENEFGLLARNFNKMVGTTGGLLSSVKSISNDTSNDANHLKESVENLSGISENLTTELIDMASRFNTQNESSHEVLRSIKELATGVEQVVQNTTDVSDLSLKTEEQANQGNDYVNRVKDQMTRISDSSKNSERIVSVLKTRSEEITGIVGLISDIAEQTNLLALNAAIEAARAGEQGRGFSVVADEVRKLAEQSRASAKEIEDLIKYIQTETDEVVTTIKDESVFIQEGVRLVDETGVVFSKILESTKEVAERLQVVTASTEQMSAENQEVSSTFEELAAISNQNNKTIEMLTDSIRGQQESFGVIVESSRNMVNVLDRLNSTVSDLKG